jgi:hypothetical protein
MLRNQWSFSYKTHELLAAVAERDREQRDALTELDSREQALNEREARQTIEERLAQLEEDRQQTGRRRNRHHEIDTERTRHHQRLDELHRVRRTLAREDPHRMFRCHLDDLEYFGL